MTDDAKLMPFSVDRALWDALLAVAEGGELSAPVRQRLVLEGLTDADGRTPVPPVRHVLDRIRSASSILHTGVVNPTHARTFTTYCGSSQSVEVCLTADRAQATPVDSSLIPVRLADHLGLGPRGLLDIAPVAAPPGLVPALMGEGDSEQLVNELIESFALTAPAVADALEDGDWRLSSTLVGSPGSIDGPGVILLDTREGAFLAAEDSGWTYLVPASTAEVWVALTTLLQKAAVVGGATGW